MKGTFVKNYWVGNDEYQIRLNSPRYYIYKLGVEYASGEYTDSELVHTSYSLKNADAFLEDEYLAYQESIIG